MSLASRAVQDIQNLLCLAEASSALCLSREKRPQSHCPESPVGLCLFELLATCPGLIEMATAARTSWSETIAVQPLDEEWRGGLSL